MKRHAAALLFAIAPLAAAPAFASPHSHEAHGAAPEARLTLDHGRRWATDEALRRYMGEIRDALAPWSEAILAGKLTNEQALTLGMHIEMKVAAIVADCKLPPEADARLHVVVADLLEAARVMQGQSKREPARGTAQAVRATQMYATYFDHPGWQPVH
jgi:hypothetical protein